MKIYEIIELYELISSGMEASSSRQESMSLRKLSLQNLQTNKLVKVAFDTRRINQETDYIPRRGLQNYHRSEQFVTQALSNKIANFQKIKTVLDELKIKYGRDPEWQDSYCRVLLNTLNQSLRTYQSDSDYSENQPSIGSFDYVEELLYTRYRLGIDNIASMEEDQIREVLLNKDEQLVRKGYMPVFNNSEKKIFKEPEPVITKREAVVQPYDALVEKLFSGVQASKENPEIERTVTITIKDKLVG